MMRFMVLGFRDRDKSYGQENHAPLHVGERKTFFSANDSGIWNDVRLPERARNRALGDGVPTLFASWGVLNGDGEWFFEESATVCAVGNGPVGFQYHNESFFKILFRLEQRFSLCVDARNLLDITEKPFTAL